MKLKLMLIVEGREDAKFLQDCIVKWFPECWQDVCIYNPEPRTPEEKAAESSRHLQEYKAVIFTANSQDKLKYWLKPAGVARQFLDVQPNAKILIIFDADAPNLKEDPENKQQRGCKAKRLHIQTRVQAVGLPLADEQIFLFPNNSSDGSLEDLLRLCVPHDHKSITICWEQYSECIVKAGYNSPSDKTMIFSYAEVQTSYKAAFGDKRNYRDTNHWNLDRTSQHLQPLHTFLKPYFDSTSNIPTP